MSISYWEYLRRSSVFCLLTMSVSFLYPTVHEGFLIAWIKIYYAIMQTGYGSLVATAFIASVVALLHYAHHSFPRKIIGILTLVFGIVAVLGVHYFGYRSAIGSLGLGGTVFDGKHPILAYARIGDVRNVSYFGLYLLWKPVVTGIFASFIAFPILFVAFIGMRGGFLDRVESNNGANFLWPLRIATSLLYGRYMQITTQRKIEELHKQVQRRGLSAVNFKGGAGLVVASAASAYTTSEDTHSWICSGQVKLATGL